MDERLLLFSFYLSIGMAFIARFANCLKIVKTSLAEQCLCIIIYSDQIHDDEWKPSLLADSIVDYSSTYVRTICIFVVAVVFRDEISEKVCNSNFIIRLMFILTFANYFSDRSR